MPPPRHILFINPWIYDFTAYDFWMKPLGLLSIASIVETYTEARISYIDCLDRFHPGIPVRTRSRPDGRGAFSKQAVSKPAVLSRVPRRFSRYGLPLSVFRAELDRIPTPELVMLSCAMTYWYPGVQLAIELVRQKFGRVPVALGGIYATLCPDHAAAESGADRILCGPGENLVLPLIRDVFGDRGAPRVGFSSLADLPDPAFHLLRNTETLSVLTSRGCPYACSYCASRRLFDGFEQLPPRRAAGLIASLPGRYGTRHLAFYDDALLVNKARHLFSIFEEIASVPSLPTLHTPNGLQVREIDRETARLLWRAGVRSVFLSQESLDDHLLSETGSAKVAPGDLAAALTDLEEAGYTRSDVSVYLLVGLPGQGVEGVRESILMVKRLGARPVLAYFSAVPGTREWERLLESGLLRAGSDPLLHNKLAFPYVFGTVSPQDFHALKSLSLPERVGA